jgi:hypothetical protein
MNVAFVRQSVVMSLRCALLAAVAQAAIASVASAGTLTTWNGANASSNNWTSSSNWTPTTPNLSGTFSLTYRGTPTRTTSANNVGNVQVDAINFTNDGTAGQTSQFTISSSSFTLLSGANVTTTAVTSGTLSDTISSGFTLPGSGNFSIGTNHNLTVSGAVSQSSGSLVKTGAGSLLFTNASTTLTGLDIQNGVVSFNNSSYGAVNATTVAIGSAGNAGTLRFNGVNGSSGVSLSMNGDAVVAVTGGGNATFTSANFNAINPSLTTPQTISLIGGSLGMAGTQIVQGAIQDNSGSGKVGVTIGAPAATNLWVLQGANTYTGATTVTADGKLLMNGSVAAGSTTTSNGFLAGSGTFGGLVNVDSGTLSPGGTSSDGGVYTDGIGTLTVGSLSLGSTATTVMTVSGSTAGAFDQIVGSGSLAYGGTLSLTLTGTSAYDDYTSFNLFNGFTSTSGSLSTLNLVATSTPYDTLSFARGADNNWYTGWVNDQRLRFSEATGTLTVVPEPSTVVFAGIGAAMCGWSTWKRRRANLRRVRGAGGIAG